MKKVCYNLPGNTSNQCSNEGQGTACTAPGETPVLNETCAGGNNT